MIADDVLRALQGSQRDTFSRALASSIVVAIQNVAEYYYVGTPQEHWDLDDFPRIVSPWPAFWMEYRTPPQIWSGQGRHLPLPFRPRWGVLGTCSELEAGTSVREALVAWASTWDHGSDAQRQLPYDAGFTDRRARWLLNLNLFSPDAGTHPYLASLTVAIAPDGQGLRGYQLVIVFDRPEDDVRTTTQQLVSAGPRNVVLLALSLANCQNVTLSEQRVPARLLAKRARRGRTPITRYYTLEIRPMARLLRDAMERTGMSLKRALHLCRGHFKDYREGPGLFGRHRGLYWWDLHARGSATAGEIRKDYAVLPPKAATISPAHKDPNSLDLLP